MNDIRSTKNQWFMEIAETVAKRGTCKRKQVGAVIVKDGIIVSTGYNGVARGEKHCEELGCNLEKSCEFSLHAEDNAIINTSRLGVSTLGCFMYVTMKPCSMCSRRIINAGIKRVYYKDEYLTNISNIKLEDYIKVIKIV